LHSEQFNLSAAEKAGNRPAARKTPDDLINFLLVNSIIKILLIVVYIYEDSIKKHGCLDGSYFLFDIFSFMHKGRKACLTFISSEIF